MMVGFTETLLSWHDFYFMVGGAAAGLAGLMFVAMSLGIHLVAQVTPENMKTFTTPSILYFMSVLLTACVMLIPPQTPLLLALALFLGGLLGFAMSFRHVMNLIRTAKENQDFTKGDWLAQVVLPALSYTLLLTAAACFAAAQWGVGFGSVWFAAIFLLIAAVTNTWSLVTWIMDQGKP
ncbi:MAG: hypothetical protein ABI835_00460 [Chloroflexota bacterium]